MKRCLKVHEHARQLFNFIRNWSKLRKCDFNNNEQALLVWSWELKSEEPKPITETE
jgi:hypothetical protein